MLTTNQLDVLAGAITNKYMGTSWCLKEEGYVIPYEEWVEQYSRVREELAKLNEVNLDVVD